MLHGHPGRTFSRVTEGAGVPKAKVKSKKSKTEAEFHWPGCSLLFTFYFCLGPGVPYFCLFTFYFCLGPGVPSFCLFTFYFSLRPGLPSFCMFSFSFLLSPLLSSVPMTPLFGAITASMAWCVSAC